MNIAILSREPRNYSTGRLVAAALARGHQVEVLNTLRCHLAIATDHPSIHYDGRELSGYDAVIPRIGASVTAYGTAVLRQFEMMNIVALNSSTAIAHSRDKLCAMPTILMMCRL
jgi:ribosomal protein S6--L-glutamate ligase